MLCDRLDYVKAGLRTQRVESIVYGLGPFVSKWVQMAPCLIEGSTGLD